MLQDFTLPIERAVSSSAEKEPLPLQNIDNINTPNSLLGSNLDIPSFNCQFSRAEGVVDAIGDLSSFDEINWNKMDIEARKEALIDLNNQISRIEGIEPCEVSFTPLESGLNGLHSNGKIVLNSDLVSKPENLSQAIETLAHETYHEYQIEAVHIPSLHSNPLEVKEWKENFENYLDPDIYGFEIYYEQPVERSAREYAREIKEDILSRNTHDTIGMNSSFFS